MPFQAPVDGHAPLRAPSFLVSINIVFFMKFGLEG